MNQDPTTTGSPAMGDDAEQIWADAERSTTEFGARWGGLLVALALAAGWLVLSTVFGPPAGATPPEKPRTTAVYTYDRVDVTRPASWENSGPQALAVTVGGFVDHPDLSSLACGQAYQVDHVRLVAADVPARIVPPQTVFDGVLVRSWHGVTAPCTPTPTEEPTAWPTPITPAPTATTTPPVTPTTPPSSPTPTPSPSGSTSPSPTASPSPTSSPTSSSTSPTSTPAPSLTPTPSLAPSPTSGLIPPSFGPLPRELAATGLSEAQGAALGLGIAALLMGAVFVYARHLQRRRDNR